MNNNLFSMYESMLKVLKVPRWLGLAFSLYFHPDFTIVNLDYKSNQYVYRGGRGTLVGWFTPPLPWDEGMAQTAIQVHAINLIKLG